MGHATDAEFEGILFARRRKGKGKGISATLRATTGKGKGRKRNPISRNGQIMRCLGNNGQCRSEYHLKRDCPRELGKGGTKGGKGSASVQVTDNTYVTDIEQLHYVTEWMADQTIQQWRTMETWIQVMET